MRIALLSVLLFALPALANPPGGSVRLEFYQSAPAVQFYQAPAYYYQAPAVTFYQAPAIVYTRPAYIVPSASFYSAPTYYYQSAPAVTVYGRTRVYRTPLRDFLFGR